MAKEFYYDTRSPSAVTEQQFFHESRAKHTDKEIGTNMPLDSSFDKDVTIKRIVCILEPLLKDSAAAKDAALFGDFLKVITEGIISIQVGDEVIEYLPLSYCLAKNAIEGDVQYTLATAANGSYGLISAQSVNGEYGLQKEIKVPKTATLKFYLKTKSSVTLANIRMVLETE